MSDLLCFDPGNVTGWAWFHDRELHAANYDSPVHLVTVAPAIRMDLVIIEKPQWRPKEKKIDINDLISLAVMVGELKERYSVFSRVELVLPTTWKGSVPKRVMCDRVLSRMMINEREKLPRRPRAKDYDHNMLDAVGIGLWKLGRLR